VTPAQAELLEAFIAFIEERSDCAASQAANGSARWANAADAEKRLRLAAEQSCEEA
jgi:hypothetical protein